MASKPLAHCCTTGVEHSGEPTGITVKLADKWDAYVATPPPNRAHHGAGILYLPDVMGIWTNSKLQADQFAAHGYLCMVVDLFAGDPMSLNRPAGFDFQKWTREGSDGRTPHTVEAIAPIVEAAIGALKKQYDIAKLGAVGYCFGAKYVIRNEGNEIAAAFVAHPSNVTDAELAAFTSPLSIAAAETDKLFPPEDRHRSEDILRAGGRPYQINLFSSVSHGFAVRGDMTKRPDRFAKVQAFRQAINWFDEWLL